MRTIRGFLLGSIVAVASIIVHERDASAFLGIDNPFGPHGVRAAIGKDKSGTGVFIDWKDRVTGECTTTGLGVDGSLSDAYIVVWLNDGNDIFIASGWFAAEQDICGFGPLVDFSYGGSNIDVSGF